MRLTPATVIQMPGILIVDDNPSIRYLLRVFVESKTAFTVCGEAGHGVEAVVLELTGND